MDRVPCRVSADLRNHYAEQDKAERDYADNLGARKDEAIEALGDEAKLKTVLNDEALAVPLARAFRNLDRAFAGDVPARDAVLQSVQQMQRQCFAWLMSKSE